MAATVARVPSLVAIARSTHIGSWPGAYRLGAAAAVTALWPRPVRHGDTVAGMSGRWRPLRALRGFERALGRGKTSRDYKRKVDRQLRSLRTTLHPEAFAFDPTEARAFLTARFPGYTDLRWHRFYGAATGRHAASYLPEDLFYFHVLPALNPTDRWAAYLDKNLTPALGLAPTPGVVARVVRGTLVDAERRPLRLHEALERAAAFPAVVIKPARNSGSGRDVRRADVADLAGELSRLVRPDGGDWLIEEAVTQAEPLAALNADSVNTYRVLTLRVSGHVHVVSTVVRVGRVGSWVDNVNAGGLVVGVADDGVLANRAYDGNGIGYTHHPDHGYAFAGRSVVPATLAHDAALAVHDAIPGLDVLSFDVAFAAGPRALLLEVNVSWQGITMHQLCHGPLFGPHQDTVVTPKRVRTVAGLVI